MTGSAWVFVFGFAIFAALVGFILEMFNNGRHSSGHGVTVAVISAVVMFIINWLIIYFGTPYFTWWSVDGWALMFFLNTIIPIIISALVGMSDDTYTGAITGICIWIALLVVWCLVMIFTTPAWCDDSGLKQMANMLNPQTAKTAYPDTDISQIIRIPESVALTKASSVLSSGPNGALGSYLAVNRAYIQDIKGKPYYVVDLKVTNWLSFNQEGGTIPGYILVDAVDTSAPADPHFGYAIRYAPKAQWAADLDRHVYMNFLLGTPYQIQDLDGMEVDDNFVPHYVGTLERQTIGYQGFSVTGLYDLDPQTGTGTQLTLAQKPSWLERVFPVEWFSKYAAEWGLWVNHAPCQFGSTLNQKLVDRVDVVATHGGLEYQITMTSAGVDQSLSDLMTVNPTTGATVLYPDFKGKTLETIESNVESAAHGKLGVLNYNAEDCQIHRLLNRNVVYCILTYKDQSTESLAAQNDAVIGGYAFVDLLSTLNGQVNSVAIEQNFDDAYADFEQIVSQTNQQSSLANTNADVQIVGTVTDNVLVDHPDAQNRSFFITVQKSDGTNVYLLAPAKMLNAAAAAKGTTVTATCYQEPGQQYLSVRHMKVDGVPDFGGGALFANFQTVLNWFKGLQPFKK